jgi:hypothetical protein
MVFDPKSSVYAGALEPIPTLPDKIMDDPVSVEASNSEFVAMLDPVIVL